MILKHLDCFILFCFIINVTLEFILIVLFYETVNSFHFTVVIVIFEMMSRRYKSESLTDIEMIAY